MNDELDPLDETLARGLGALAPAEFELDADRTLGALRPALRRARLQRRVATATTALGLLAVVVAGAAVIERHPGSKVDVQARDRPTRPTTIGPLRSTTTRVSTSTSTSVPRTITPTTVPDHRTTTTLPRQDNQGPGARPVTTTPAPTPTTTPAGQRGSTTTTTTPPGTTTYVAIGGRVTIRFAAGRLTLVSRIAAPGYAIDLRTNTASEIEVRFSNGRNESRIRVRVKDGALEPEISQT